MKAPTALRIWTWLLYLDAVEDRIPPASYTLLSTPARVPQQQVWDQTRTRQRVASLCGKLCPSLPQNGTEQWQQTPPRCHVPRQLSWPKSLLLASAPMTSMAHRSDQSDSNMFATSRHNTQWHPVTVVPGQAAGEEGRIILGPMRLVEARHSFSTLP